jgi:hypothetical protein
VRTPLLRTAVPPCALTGPWQPRPNRVRKRRKDRSDDQSLQVECYSGRHCGSRVGELDHIGGPGWCQVARHDPHLRVT